MNANQDINVDAAFRCSQYQTLLEWPTTVTHIKSDYTGKLPPRPHVISVIPLTPGHHYNGGALILSLYYLFMFCTPPFPFQKNVFLLPPPWHIPLLPGFLADQVDNLGLSLSESYPCVESFKGLAFSEQFCPTCSRNVS